MIQIILEKRFGLLLERIHKGLCNLLLEDFEIGLVQRVLQELQVLLARIIRQISCLNHVDQGLAHVNGINSFRAVCQRIIQRLHNKARRCAKHTLAPGLIFKLAHVDLERLTFLDDFFAIVETQFGHQIAFSSRFESGQDCEHTDDL